MPEPGIEHRVREPGFDGRVREFTREGWEKDVEMLAVEEFETARYGGLEGEVVETKEARERAKIREEHAYDVMLALADYLGYEVQGR